MKKKHFFAFIFAACLTVSAIAPCSLYAAAQTADTANSLSGTPNYTVNYSGTEDASGYLFPESSEFKFQGFSSEHEPWVYQYGVNEIYAKHGYSFQTPEVSALFSSKTWYTPNSSFQESLFSETEKYNIDFLSQCLSATGKDGGYGIPSGNHPQTSGLVLNEEGEKIKEDLKNIQLNHNYITRFPDVNQITYPHFTFDYPDGWTITQEEVSQSGETVTLTSESGAQVQYSHIGGEISGGSMASMSRVEVSPIAESRFVPGYVQANDYSSLGTFAVAQLKTTGTLNMQADSDFTEVDGPVSYGVLPVSEMGTAEVNLPYVAEFSFDYSGNIALIGSAPSEKEFTEQDKLETIAILSSFRPAY